RSSDLHAVPLHSDPNHPCSPSPVVAQLSVFRRVAPVGLKASPICGRAANCKGHLWFACAPDWRFASDPADFPSPGTPCPGLGFTRSALLFLATPLQLGESGGGTLTRWSAALRGAQQRGPASWMLGLFAVVACRARDLPGRVTCGSLLE